MAPRKQYDPEKMAKALEETNQGVPVATAAKKYGVPRTTLLHKKQGKSTLICSPGPATTLSTEEESLLVSWILALAERHFPVTKTQLIDSVQKIMNESKKEKKFENDNRPSDNWYRLFLKRHPEISPRICQNLTQCRETVSEIQIRGWFEEIKAYLVSNSLFDITDNPTRVFNTDESAFYLSPKSNKVLVKKGEKSVYTASGDEKENLTVLVTTNAEGKMAPPMIVFSYTRIPGYIAASIPEKWAIGTSENGWMCAPTFFEYICNVFNPWLEEQQIQKPVILFMDGHSSHLTLHLSNFCKENGIELVALYPNSTHLLQPLDVAVFRPLKLFFKNEVQNWRIENLGNRLQKQHFAKVFEKALQHITEDTIKNGFRACGLCPFEVKNVHFEKISKRNYRSMLQNPMIFKTSAKNTLRGLEERLDQKRLEAFEKCLLEKSRWNGPIEDASLFEIWKNLKDENQERNTNAENDDQQEEYDVQQLEEPEVNQEITAPEMNQELEKEKPAINEDMNIPKHHTPEKQETNLRSIYENTGAVPSTSSQFDNNIPTPFKKALFWPDPKPSTKKRKSKEKIPSVITSNAWRNYHAKKEYEKRRKLEEKEQRMELRKEKKELKMKKSKNESLESSSEDEAEWRESGNSSDDVDIFEQSYEFCELKNCDNVSVGDYIVAKFLGGKRQATVFKYVCVVQKIFENQEIQVMSMKSIRDKKIFIFNENDESCITKDSVLGILPAPEILGAGERLKYEFPLPVNIFEA